MTRKGGERKSRPFDFLRPKVDSLTIILKPADGGGGASVSFSETDVQRVIGALNDKFGDNPGLTFAFTQKPDHSEGIDVLPSEKIKAEQFKHRLRMAHQMLSSGHGLSTIREILDETYKPVQDVILREIVRKVTQGLLQ